MKYFNNISHINAIYRASISYKLIYYFLLSLLLAGDIMIFALTISLLKFVILRYTNSSYTFKLYTSSLFKNTIYHSRSSVSGRSLLISVHLKSWNIGQNSPLYRMRSSYDEIRYRADT